MTAADQLANARVRALARTYSSIQVYLLAVAVFIATCIAIPGFFSANSIRSLLVLASILGIASMGQTLTIILGGIDLSIAPMIGLSSILIGQLGERGLSFGVTLLIVLVTASAVGAVNGLLSYVLRAPALIVTLAVGFILTGVTLVLNRGSAGGIVPDWITDSVAINGSTFGIPLPRVVVGWIVAGIALVFLQPRLPFLKRVRAVGVNARAAELSLIRLPIIWIGTFAFSAVMAAAAGIFLAGFSAGADVSVGTPYLFLTIAAVVVGGTSLLGGRGGQGRTMAGAFVVSNLTTLLLGLGIGSDLQESLLGVLIVVLVVIHGRESHVSARI